MASQVMIPLQHNTADDNIIWLSLSYAFYVFIYSAADKTHSHRPDASHQRIPVTANLFPGLPYPVNMSVIVSTNLSASF